jgi:hypothetical protein
MLVDDNLNPDELKQVQSKKPKHRPSEEEFISLFRTNNENPRAVLISGEELREAFRSRRWDERSAPAMRDNAEGCGKLRVYYGPHRQMLAGLPVMVDAYTKQQSEVGTIMEDAPLAKTTKPKCKKRKKNQSA